MAAAELLGATGSIAGTIINNAWAQSHTEYDRSLNYMYNEMAARNADKRTRALYGDFYSPEALMRQYKAAGLSPSLMFGGTPGQGGMSGAQANGASGLQTPFAPLSMVEAAQAAALFAQAEKTKEETNLIKPLGESEIAKNLADAGHAAAAAAAAEAQAAGTKLDNYVKEHTLDASIYTICELAEQQAHATEKMYHEMRSAKVLADIDEKTFNTEVKRREQEVESLIQSIKVGKSQERLNDQQVKDLKDQILARIEETSIKWKEVNIKEQQTQTYTDWINAQIPYIESQIELKLKELGIEKWKVATDAITNTIKAIAIGAAAASQFKGGNLSPEPQQVLGQPSQPFN